MFTLLSPARDLSRAPPRARSRSRRQEQRVPPDRAGPLLSRAMWCCPSPVWFMPLLYLEAVGTKAAALRLFSGLFLSLLKALPAGDQRCCGSHCLMPQLGRLRGTSLGPWLRPRAAPSSFQNWVHSLTNKLIFWGAFFHPSTPAPLGKLLLNLCNAGRSAPSGSVLLPSSPFPQLASSLLAFFAQPKFLFVSQPSFCWRKGAGTQAACTAPSSHVPVPQSTARGTKAEPQTRQWTKDFAMRFLI